MEYKINVPFTKEEAINFKTGDNVLLTGWIYTARDAAHKKMTESIAAGEPLPFEISGQIIYYAGPCPAKPGQVIGSCGPTTSGRMDKFTPTLIKSGLSGMIGKGEVSPEVIKALKDNGGIYFVTIGGAGALIAKCIKSAEVVCYGELGTEAVRKLYIEDFPAVVALDCEGNNIYEK